MALVVVVVDMAEVQEEVTVETMSVHQQLTIKPSSLPWGQSDREISFLPQIGCLWWFLVAECQQECSKNYLKVFCVQIQSYASDLYDCEITAVFAKKKN